jgi:hypothetical protein
MKKSKIIPTKTDKTIEDTLVKSLLEKVDKNDEDTLLLKEVFDCYQSRLKKVHKKAFKF